MKIGALDFRLLFFLVLLSLFLMLFDSLGFLAFPKSLAQTITAPVQYGLYKSVSSLGRQVEFITVARYASLENLALKQQLGELLTENADLRKKLSESEVLVDQYGKLNPRTYDLLPARIIGSGRYLVIDKGTEDGVQVGQVVVFKDNYVGKVKSAGPKVSQVLLSLDPDSKIAVFSQNDNGRARGILQGQFGSELLMDKILHEESIKVGDLVYSEGTEGQLPRGLVIGKVSQIAEKQNEVFKQAKVTPIFVQTYLDVVFVIRSPR